MKNIKLIVTKIIFSTAILILSTNASAYDGIEGMIMNVLGKVEVQDLNQQIHKAFIGMKVHETDSIITSANSKCKIVMQDKNVLTLGPETNITLAQYRNSPSEKRVQIDLNKGQIRATIDQKYNERDASFEIKTKGSVSGVRGTDFLVQFNESEKQTKVVTFHGSVRFSNLINTQIASTVFVNAGEYSISNMDQFAPSKPQRLNFQDLQKVNHLSDGHSNQDQQRNTSSDLNSNNAKFNTTKLDIKSELLRLGPQSTFNGDFTSSFLPPTNDGILKDTIGAGRTFIRVKLIPQ